MQRAEGGVIPADIISETDDESTFVTLPETINIAHDNGGKAKGLAEYAKRLYNFLRTLQSCLTQFTPNEIDTKAVFLN